MSQNDPFRVEDHSCWVPHKRETWPFQYMTCRVPVTLRIWNGYEHSVKNLPEFTEKVIPVGGTLKIVMASRFGDVGLTDDLQAEHGYHARVDLDKLAEMFENPRNTP